MTGTAKGGNTLRIRSVGISKDDLAQFRRNLTLLDTVKEPAVI